jgi:hypothetical protein
MGINEATKHPARDAGIDKAHCRGSNQHGQAKAAIVLKSKIFSNFPKLFSKSVDTLGT